MIPSDLENIPQNAWPFSIHLLKKYWLGIQHIRGTLLSNTINEIKNSLKGINRRITEAEERTSDLEDKIVEKTTAEQNKQKRMYTDGLQTHERMLNIINH